MNNKHIWEGWTVQDFINELEPTFNRIVSNCISFNGHSWTAPFKDDKELKEWLKDNQPYYKKHIPEVFNYFKAKLN
jgi:hypothetical protein